MSLILAQTMNPMTTTLQIPSFSLSKAPVLVASLTAPVPGFFKVDGGGRGEKQPNGDAGGCATGKGALP